MKTNKSGKWQIGVAVLTIVVLSMALLRQAQPTTPGEKFRKAIRKIENACASRQLNPNEQCGEVAKLKPADPLATAEGRFAHAIKLPEPLPEDSGYQVGMTPREYFDHLCKTEAGEFVYKTAADVRSVFVMRSRAPATDDQLRHLYALEDPYGEVSGEFRDLREFVQPDLGRYERVETPLSLRSQTDEAVREFYRANVSNSSRHHQTARNGQMVLVPYVVSERIKSKLSSKYGFTWRGIERPYDREMGIAGGELIVLNLESNSILGVRRGFVRTGFELNGSTGVWWLSGETCPRLSSRPNRMFIYDVLRPARLPVLEEME
jgi:hypothetical protein